MVNQDPIVQKYKTSRYGGAGAVRPAPVNGRNPRNPAPELEYPRICWIWTNRLGETMETSLGTPIFFGYQKLSDFF